MGLEKKQDYQYYNENTSQSALLIEFISKLNSKDITPDRIKEFKILAGSIENNEIKKILLVDKLYGDNYLAKIVAIEVLSPALISDEEVRSLLLTTLKTNNHEPVKKVIINSIMPFINKYREIESCIISILSNRFETSGTKETAISVLASRLFKPEIREIIKSKLDDESSQVRIAAINSLSYYTDEIEIYESLIKKLEDKDNDVKVAAIKALGLKADRDEIKTALISKLNDYNEYQYIKETIIETLSNCLEKSVSLQEEFVTIFFNDNNSVIRDKVKRALLKNMPIDVLQDLFASKLVFEKSNACLKNNVKNKLDRLGQDDGADQLDQVLNLNKRRNDSQSPYSI